MAGILDQLIRPRKKTVHHSDLKAIELEAAREILAEVFKVRLSEVDEMIQNRFQAADNDDMVSKEDRMWPREFWLEDPAL